MKYTIFPLLIFTISNAIAQNSYVPALQTVLSDSVVTHYISTYADIDTSQYILSGKEGDFVFQDGKVSYRPSSDMQTDQYSGYIKKLKIGPGRSVVKIYFEGASSFLAKIKLEHFSPKRPWHIKSRLVRLKLKDFSDQPQLFYFSFN